MRVLQPSLHRVLDFVTVVAFAAAPTAFGLTGFPAWLSYGLAAVHLGLTLSTRFPSQPRGRISFPFHGMVELFVGAALVFLPFVLAWQGAAYVFYVSAGVVIFVVWMLSDYRAHDELRLM